MSDEDNTKDVPAEEPAVEEEKQTVQNADDDAQPAAAEEAPAAKPEEAVAEAADEPETAVTESDAAAEEKEEDSKAVDVGMVDLQEDEDDEEEGETETQSPSKKTWKEKAQSRARALSAKVQQKSDERRLALEEKIYRKVCKSPARKVYLERLAKLRDLESKEASGDVPYPWDKTKKGPFQTPEDGAIMGMVNSLLVLSISASFIVFGMVQVNDISLSMEAQGKDNKVATLFIIALILLGLPAAMLIYNHLRRARNKIAFNALLKRGIVMQPKPSLVIAGQELGWWIYPVGFSWIAFAIVLCYFQFVEVSTDNDSNRLYNAVKNIVVASLSYLLLITLHCKLKMKSSLGIITFSDLITSEPTMQQHPTSRSKQISAASFVAETVVLNDKVLSWLTWNFRHDIELFRRLQDGKQSDEEIEGQKHLQTFDGKNRLPPLPDSVFMYIWLATKAPLKCFKQRAVPQQQELDTFVDAVNKSGLYLPTKHAQMVNLALNFGEEENDLSFLDDPKAFVDSNSGKRCKSPGVVSSEEFIYEGDASAFRANRVIDFARFVLVVVFLAFMTLYVLQKVVSGPATVYDLDSCQAFLDQANWEGTDLAGATDSQGNPVVSNNGVFVGDLREPQDAGDFLFFQECRGLCIC